MAAPGVAFVGQMEPQFIEPFQLSPAAARVWLGTGYFHRPKERFHIFRTRGEGSSGSIRKPADDALHRFTCGPPSEHIVSRGTRHEPEWKIRIEMDPMALACNGNESPDRGV